MIDLLSFYQYATIPIRFSRFKEFHPERQQQYLEYMQQSGKIIEVVAYCLMPNHFHLLLRQKQEKGIATYVGNFINAYTKYFNTKYERKGNLFQGVFKAVHIKTDEQLLHLTRYIHLNPVASSMITPEALTTFPWSSYSAYTKVASDAIVTRDTINIIRAMVPAYELFVTDQIAHAQELEQLKHMPEV
jgi:putative transposase